jgi:hypothetical protein
MSKVANSFFRQRLSRSARQALLVLDCWADPTTRIASLTQHGLGEITGYKRSAIKLALKHLTASGHVCQAGRGRIQLLHGEPERSGGHYFIVSRELLQFNDWEDWELQLFYFIKSCYLTTDAEYLLDLFQVRMNAIEKHCSLPGRTRAARFDAATGFIRKLCQSGVLHKIMETHSRGTVYMLDGGRLRELVVASHDHEGSERSGRRVGTHHRFKTLKRNVLEVGGNRLEADGLAASQPIRCSSLRPTPPSPAAQAQSLSALREEHINSPARGVFCQGEAGEMEGRVLNKPTHQPCQPEQTVDMGSSLLARMEQSFLARQDLVNQEKQQTTPVSPWAGRFLSPAVRPDNNTVKDEQLLIEKLPSPPPVRAADYLAKLRLQKEKI